VDGKVKMTIYRSRWEIIREILKITQAEKDAKKTRIMNKAYIDSKNFKKYLEFLMNENFINRTNDDKYIITSDGKELLKKLDDIKAVMKK